MPMVQPIDLNGDRSSAVTVREPSCYGVGFELWMKMMACSFHGIKLGLVKDTCLHRVGIAILLGHGGLTPLSVLRDRECQNSRSRTDSLTAIDEPMMTKTVNET